MKSIAILALLGCVSATQLNALSAAKCKPSSCSACSSGTIDQDNCVQNLFDS